MAVAYASDLFRPFAIVCVVHAACFSKVYVRHLEIIQCMCVCVYVGACVCMRICRHTYERPRKRNRKMEGIEKGEGRQKKREKRKKILTSNSSKGSQNK